MKNEEQYFRDMIEVIIGEHHNHLALESCASVLGFINELSLISQRRIKHIGCSKDIQILNTLFPTRLRALVYGKFQT